MDVLLEKEEEEEEDVSATESPPDAPEADAEVLVLLRSDNFAEALALSAASSAALALVSAAFLASLAARFGRVILLIIFGGGLRMRNSDVLFGDLACI